MNVWNKGLTKETDKRVLSYVREGSLSHLFKSGRKLHKGYWYLHISNYAPYDWNCDFINKWAIEAAKTLKDK